MSNYIHWSLVLASFLCGCGGSSSGSLLGSTPDGSAAGSTAACDAVAKARCERRDACTNNLANTVRFGDEATCEAREKLACVASLQASGTGATPTSVEACASALPSESCTDLLDDNPSPACTPQSGHSQNGSACLFDAQCQSTYCSVPKGSACGTCAAMPKAGDSCSATGSCGRDLACPSSTSLCVARGALNASCEAGNPCAHGLTCVGATKTTAGTCQTSGSEVGTACDPKQKTAPGCDKDLGLFCDPTTMKCAAAVPAKATEPCGVLAGGDAYCIAGATCQIAMGASAGTCVAAAADGAACDPYQGPFCTTPAHCVIADGGTQGTCKTPDTLVCK